jgi:hypothetical protein
MQMNADEREFKKIKEKRAADGRGWEREELREEGCRWMYK